MQNFGFSYLICISTKQYLMLIQVVIHAIIKCNNCPTGGSMLFIYLSLLEFVFVNYIGRKRPRPPSDFADQPTIQVTNIISSTTTIFNYLYKSLYQLI